jgi:hypothetical protein
MNWLLPPLTEADFREHLAACENLSSRVAAEDDSRRAGDCARYTFTPQRSEPGLKPQAGDHLFVRVEDDVVGWHHVIGTNRAFEPDGRTPCGWQVLYNAQFHELDDYVPAPRYPNFAVFRTADPN